ncbi:MAG: hypothetical protein KIS78_10670 [Labilithrix sp.]|nr:hypothetical protein [Labilithrix sp.]
MLRYANETPLPNEPAVIGDGGAKARNFPGNGPEVATLPKGTAVVKVAQYFNTGVLILFDDPSGDGSKLVGWVTPKVFDATAPEPTVKPIVPVPVVKVDAGSNAAVQDAGAPRSRTPATASRREKDAGRGGSAVVDAGGAKSS